MSYDIKFVTTDTSGVASLPVVNGQVIALSDKNAWFYDMNDTRHVIRNNVYCGDTLPATGDAETLYVRNSSNAEDTGIYIWTGSAFAKICGLDSKEVTTALASTGKVYLVGTTSAVAGNDTLVKNVNVYIDMATREVSITASNAINDSEGNPINTTYLKEVTISKSGSTITVTSKKGDDTTSTTTVEDDDTTYNTFGGTNGTDPGTAGLVPAPAVADKAKFLKGDGSWGNPVNTEYSEMSGATSSAAGSSGLVPAPAAGENEKYLRGDGTWVTPPNDNTEYDVMGGASATLGGAEGLVPAPSAGDQGKFLKGDGSWAEVETTDTKNTVGATAASDKILIVGAVAQAAEQQSYTNDKAYVSADGKLFSNDKEVVNLSDAQALTNKTYNGYTLGAASEKGVASAIAEDGTDLPTAGQVHSALQDILQDAKDYTDNAISGVIQFTVIVADELPTGESIKANTIYLVPSDKTATDNVKTEYMYINGAWEIIGSTQIDLSPYSTTEQMNSAISSALSTALADYAKTDDILDPDKSPLPDVVASGSYNDLLDKPTIGDGTLTIKKNGVAVDTFKANATADKEIDITVPTKFSDLTQDKILLVDDVTSKVYKLGVSNGKICIEEVTE